MSDHIQVVIRVRPFNDKEIRMKVQSCVEIDEQDLFLGKQDDYKQFSFDKIFDEEATQEQIFDVIGRPISNVFLDGYNACVFAYGQTGAGKTHTMFGGNNKDQNIQGLQTLILKEILDNLPQDPDISIITSCSYFEIYNEKIIDLLKKLPKTQDNSKQLQIKEDIKKGVYIEGIKTEFINDYKDILEVISKGNQNRHYAETRMNMESSRSHVIFQFFLELKTVKQGVTYKTNSKINFVDLAGSERQRDTGATGERFTESKNINKSLTMLGRVINELGEKTKRKQDGYHVPFRDSKLTYILKDSLGGNTKCVMIANITQADQSYAETLSTLKFAQRTKMIETKVEKNEEMSGNIKYLQKEIKMLRRQVREQIIIIDNLKQQLKINKNKDDKIQQNLQQEVEELQKINEQKQKTEEEIQKKLLQSEFQQNNKEEDLLEGLEEEVDKQQQQGDDLIFLMEEIDRLKQQSEEKDYLFCMQESQIQQLQDDINFLKDQNKLQEQQLLEKDNLNKQLLEQVIEKENIEQDNLLLSDNEDLLSDNENSENKQKQQNITDIQENQEINQIENQKQQLIEQQTQEDNLKQQKNNSKIQDKNLKNSILKQNTEQLETQEKQNNTQQKNQNLNIEDNENEDEEKPQLPESYEEDSEENENEQIKALSPQNYQKSKTQKNKINAVSQIYSKPSKKMQKSNTTKSQINVGIRASQIFNYQTINQDQKLQTLEKENEFLKLKLKKFQRIQDNLLNGQSFVDRRESFSFYKQNMSRLKQRETQIFNNESRIEQIQSRNQSILKPNIQGKNQKSYSIIDPSYLQADQGSQQYLQSTDKLESQNDLNNLEQLQEGNTNLNSNSNLDNNNNNINQDNQDIILNLMSDNENLKNQKNELNEEFQQLQDENERLKEENDTLKQTVFFVSNQLQEKRESHSNPNVARNFSQVQLSTRQSIIQEEDESDFQTQESEHRSKNKNNSSIIQNSNRKRSSFTQNSQQGSEQKDNSSEQKTNNFQENQSQTFQIQESLNKNDPNTFFQYYSRNTFQILINEIIKLDQFISSHQKSLHPDFIIYVFLVWQTQNQITPKTLVRTLIKFFQKVQSQQVLLINLMGNEISDSNFDNICNKGISQLHSLKEFEINLNHNKLTDKSLEILGNVLSSLPNLQKLSLNIQQNEKITNKGYVLFLQNLAQIQNLQQIKIDSNLQKFQVNSLNKHILEHQAQIEYISGLQINRVAFTETGNKQNYSNEDNEQISPSGVHKPRKGRLSQQIPQTSMLRDVNEKRVEQKNTKDGETCKCSIF